MQSNICLTLMRRVLKALEQFQWNVESNAGLLCIFFTSLCDWYQRLVPRSRPIRRKTKTKVLTWSRAFYRALGSLVVRTMSSHCLLKEFTFILLGSCDFFGFGFTTLSGKYFTSYLFSFTFELKPDEHCKLCNSVVMNQKISWIEVQEDFNS